ncbi:MAG: alpha-1,4-glucan--maltose-1-phosphate maltosyltransferase [Acidimicrobiales bacterium]
MPRHMPAPIAEVVIEHPEPLVDGGRFPAKAIVGDPLEVSADIFTHGHDLVRGSARTRRVGARRWSEVPMHHDGNDRYSSIVVASAEGLFEIEIAACIDPLATWARDARRRIAAGIAEPCENETAARLLREAADGLASRRMRSHASLLMSLASRAGVEVTAQLLDELDSFREVLSQRPISSQEASTVRLRGLASRQKAVFSTWYELFPRSASPDQDRAGTLGDVVDRLDYVARLGFDVLYLPPIHPIGITARKGKGNDPIAGPDDVGSPWAIGSSMGGHTAIAPELGTLEDFDDLVGAAKEHDIEIALDLAFQCSPDHPWVKEHPDWFKHRTDGTIACAENPPKRYEDIYPIDFTTDDSGALWQALADVVRFWTARGVRIFRVDNPHTKPFAFWEWLIAGIKQETPDVLFLSEAFTRPKVMHRLAKLGFDQSYTYFTWRNHKAELEEYFVELVSPPGIFYLRPNIWPNTPDILPESLQHGGRPSFVSRLVLAAGLSASYGIYGPVFELGWDKPLTRGSEEYLHSEKYEVHHHDLDDPSTIAGLIALVNTARHLHPALQRNDGLHFHHVDNEQLICWSKRSVGGDAVIGVVNLDWRFAQSGFVELDAHAIGLETGQTFMVRDALSQERYSWVVGRNFVKLDPTAIPAHLLAVEAAS